MAKEQTEYRINGPEIRKEWCKGCGICVHFCPKQVLQLDRDEKAFVAYGEQCIGCGMCERRCPDLAVELVYCKKEEVEVSRASEHIAGR
ncbi:MAG: 4Fe-4S dicluster domain-containing protein [Thermodesulfobacteriota bacterium]